MTSPSIPLLVAACLLMVGCMAHKAPPTAIDDLERAVQVVDPPRPVVPIVTPGQGANFELLPPDGPEVRAAMDEFERTGRAPQIRKGGFVYIPYDGYQTNVYCMTTRVCRIELAAGEVPVENGVFLGDTARWWWGLGVHGAAPSRVFSILFKPLWSAAEGEETCDYSTNMVVQTNLRTYQFGLLCNEQQPYTRVLRFYYPDEVTKAWAAAARAAESESEEAATEAPLVLAVDIEHLNIDDYRIDGDDVEWRPVRAFDDGTHVYLQMPAEMKAGEAPAVFVQTDDGELGLVNYRHIGRYLRIDRRFKEAVLLAGKGRQQKRVRVQYVPSEG